MQEVFAVLADGAYDAVILLGPGGCGKTVLGENVHGRAVITFGEEGAARCAQSGRHAANARCMTLARRFRYGSYMQRAQIYLNLQAADEVAQIQMLIIEEATSVPNHMLQQHIGARTAARKSVNLARTRLQQDAPYEITTGLDGLKLMVSGDHLQQIVSTGSVGRVIASGEEAGVAVPAQPAKQGKCIWDLPILQGAKVLVIVAHGNHRLLGMMHKLHCTGCGSLGGIGCRLMLPCQQYRSGSFTRMNGLTRLHALRSEERASVVVCRLCVAISYGFWQGYVCPRRVGHIPLWAVQPRSHAMLHQRHVGCC